MKTLNINKLKREMLKDFRNDNWDSKAQYVNFFYENYVKDSDISFERYRTSLMNDRYQSVEERLNPEKAIRDFIDTTINDLSVEYQHSNGNYDYTLKNNDFISQRAI